MTTGEGAVARDARDEHDRPSSDGGRISVGGGDDAVTRIQLAARWAEAYGHGPDSLGAILRRFRAAYEYLDAVTHSIEPGDLPAELQTMQPVVAPAGTQLPDASARPGQPGQHGQPIAAAPSQPASGAPPS